MYFILAGYNIIVFLIFGLDKIFAFKKMRRISERALLLLSLFMGAVGGCLGMFMFSHKTRKLKFTLVMPMLLILNVICIMLFEKTGLFKFLKY